MNTPQTAGAADSSAPGEEFSGPPLFATTHWSVVLTASGDDNTRTRDALSRLCKTYWPALYAYARRRGFSPHDSEDVTQEFFARLLERNWIGRARREKGRFRSFLLTVLNRYIADEWDKGRAQKRGGGQRAVSMDTETAERQYREDLSDGMSADQLYDRRWAMALLERVMGRLREEFSDAGKTREFEHLKTYLTAEREDISYPEAAAAAGLSEGAARVAVHRLRKRYRDLFREEIAHTVSAQDEVEAELRYLVKVLARQ